MKIRSAKSKAEITACYPVFKALRPHLVEAEFVTRVRRQQSEGYRLIYVAQSKRVVAAAGFRFMEFLAWGRVLYIDDLITHPEERGSGYGGALMDWLISHGRKRDCDELHLDSGYQRQDAHRLYLNKGLQLGCHHFSMRLKTKMKRNNQAQQPTAPRGRGSS
jgi:GNAT superfamily N-acetyltransferase